MTEALVTQDNDPGGLLGGQIFSPQPLIRSYRVGVFELDPQQTFPLGVAALASGEATLLMVFGPSLDPKVEYVSHQLANATPVIPGAWLAHLPGPVSPHLDPHQVAILDERDRPWAFFGGVDSKDSAEAATAVLAHPDFHRAVNHARSTARFLIGVEPTYPPDIEAILGKGPQRATDEERARVVSFIDSHWSDPPAPS